VPRLPCRNRGKTFDCQLITVNKADEGPPGIIIIIATVLSRQPSERSATIQ
jgi:hypothetical protein